MKQIRESKFSKIVAYYLIIMMVLQITAPTQMYALTGGPSQPEFSSFTPIGTSDMVDLSSGDFNYNIPIMDVGGYPLNLAYNSGVTMDQEASWVGLGWDMSVGQINRQVRGLPDDFNGDKMIYENNMKPNTTIGSNFNVFLAPFGAAENLTASVGMGIKYNTYDGYGCSVDGGLTYQLHDNLSVGLKLESSSTDGVSASPSVSLHAKYTDKTQKENNLTGSLGVSMNSRKGIEAVTMSASRERVIEKGEKGTENHGDKQQGSIGGSISFVDASFTPAKRVGMSSTNYMFNLNIEGAIYGVDPGFKFSGYRTSQNIKSSEKYKVEKAYGYENTTKAGLAGVLDFNREKDRTVTKNTLSLPVTNYTYDLYSVQGQGVGGMFRPYRSQVGFVYDNYTQDDSFGVTAGVEAGGGAGSHTGYNGDATKAKSSSGIWIGNNPALNRALENNSKTKPNYEKVFFKNIGGTHVDKDMIRLLNDKLGGYDPINFKLKENDKFNRSTSLRYFKNVFDPSSVIPMGTEPYIRRGDNRLNRNQVIQKITREEAYKFGTRSFSPFANRKAQKNHTSEIRIIKDGGERYVYGRAAYNKIKKEVTFDVGTTPNEDCKTGLVSYGGNDNTPDNSQGGDQYFNRITTPAYAHSYLLTSVFSSDYQDLKNDGASDDDLGTYTKFSYTNKSKTDNGENFAPYKWRVPYRENHANYDEGLKSLNKDNKGNYQYGEKELLYINKIETKTHVAIFTISARKDGYGVKGENGGRETNPSNSSKMWKLDKITLYSKPEYLAHKDDLENAVPIKVAHFEYDYSLCKGVENNFNEPATGPVEQNNQGGKLTLKKVYFTYGKSSMGKYTPYQFNYDENNNPNYNQKDYDIWGNYKKSNYYVGCGTLEALSNAEYPYVDQSNQADADKNESAWLLKSIDLPSGGQMELSYESDDYRYVQDKEVMQMFKVVGAGADPLPPDVESLNLGEANTGPLKKLFSHSLLSSEENKYLYIKLDKACSNDDFFKNYIKGLGGQKVYFRFLLNMTSPKVSNPDKFDYVTGYLDINSGDTDSFNVFSNGVGANTQHYAAIKIDMVNRGDGMTGGGNNVHPVSKAGWYFGRQYLNNVVYSLTGKEDVNDLEGVVKNLINIVPKIFDIFRSPNQQLIEDEIASNFVPGKSWIRLMHPEQKKLGGGSRVKEIKIHDNWDVMTNHRGEEVYKQFYGQQYSYETTDKDGKKWSSGVATYEPLGSKENPFVYPFFDHSRPATLLGPDSENYVELPFGECFFPSPKITYSSVTVKNLPREKTNASNVITIKKHATGSVTTEFFTSKDYPTISDISVLDPKYDDSILGGLLNLNVKTHVSLTQGFSIHTNDMDGKMKSQKVYAEGQTSPISGMEYKYEQLSGNNRNKGKLNNEVTTIDSHGNVKPNIVGVDYDVINDFRENRNETKNAGIHFQLETLPLTLLILVVPAPIPSLSKHESLLRTAVTTKVIHSSGILRETIAFDLNSKVSTKNLAWDADTGNVILTETVNEYDDKYFNFNFPAYWAYDGMSQAALNLNLEWNISKDTGSKYKFDRGFDADDYLIDGDELWVTPTTPNDKNGFKAWVVNVNGNSFDLIDDKGVKVIDEESENRPLSKVIKIGKIKVIKSGHRNMATASMASITLMKNPLIGNSTISHNTFLSNTPDANKIVNASAIEYKDMWPSQCECGLPQMKFKTDDPNTLIDESKELSFEFNANSTDDFDIIEKRSYNPYIYNVLGNWRAVKSHAYLTGRNNNAQTPRLSGFFNDFRSFYDYNTAKSRWEVSTEPDSYSRWTFASEVSQYNAWGQEVENKDALERYSSALYGYNNRFPVAVASNTKYKELAFDGFEDYDFAKCNEKSHFSYEGGLVKNKVSITNKQSHTGRRSIRLEPKAKTSMQKKIVNCGVAAANKATTKKAAKK